MPNLPINKYIEGDCLAILPSFPDAYFDTVITDPPYGLKFMGKKWDYAVPSIAIWEEVLRVAKPGATMLCFAGSRTQHRMACNIEDAGWILKDCIMWLYGSGFPKATDISKQLDKRAGAEREIVGVGDIKRASKTIPMRQGIKGANDTRNITAPATPEAQLWDGWKSHGLKPAYEPILVAMKPNEGSYAENALKHGIAGLNIDGGRIEGEEPHHNYGRTSGENSFIGKSKEPSITPPHGRYPANVILDEEAAELLDEQSGVTCHKRNGKRKESNQSIFGVGNKGEIYAPGDSGGASRFFYCAKASKAERGEGNSHPTVKPLKLMEYLCNLTKTPTGGIVLDCFAGSGTTGVACINTDRDYVLIDNDPENKIIAEARLKHAMTRLQGATIGLNFE